MINYSKLENQEPLDSRDESIKILEGRINKHTISGNDTQVNKLKKKLEELQKEPEHIPERGKREREILWYRRPSLTNQKTCLRHRRGGGGGWVGATPTHRGLQNICFDLFSEN